MDTNGNSDHALSSAELRPDMIDIDHFSQLSSSQHKVWVSKNRKDAEQSAFDRMVMYYGQLPSLDGVPRYVSLCCDPGAFPKEVHRVDGRATKPPILPCVVYLSQRFGVSCNELLFGTKKPLELFGRTASFVRQISKLSPECQERVLSTLNDNRVIANNHFYVFKYRCYEAAFFQGKPAKTLVNFWWASPYQREVLSEIFNTDISSRLSDLQGTRLDTGHGSFTLMLRFCAEFNLAADYFLIQDYSQSAQLGGRSLAEQEKQWLSAYLCATPAAQETAICQMAAALVDNGKV